MSRQALEQAMNALGSGDTAAFDQAYKETVGNTPTPVIEESDGTGTDLEESLVAPELGQEAEGNSESEEELLVGEQAPSVTSEGNETSSSSSPNMIEVAFTDHKGRRKTKIDLTDVDKVKRLASIALGAPKWKVERDQYKEQLSKQQELVQNLKSSYGKLEEAFGEGGAEGIAKVVKLLARDENALDKLLDARQAERERLARMPEHERRLVEAENQRIADRIEYEKRLAVLSAKEKAALAKEEEAQLKQVTARAQASYEKYSFDGKLGDAEQEQDWSQYVWDKAIDLLSSRGINNPTQRQMDTAFKIYHDKLSKGVSSTASKRAETVVNKAKVNAERSAAAIVGSKMNTSGNEFTEKFRKNSVGAISDLILGRK